jgi:glutaredoxin
VEPIKIRVYSKKDCHLCGEAKAILSAYARRYPISIEEIDIEQDADAWEAYQYEIPVIFFEGRKLFKYHVDPKRLERAIVSHMEAAAAQQQAS